MGSTKKVVEGPAVAAACFGLLLAVIGCPPSPVPDVPSRLPAQLWGIELERTEPVGGVALGHFRSDDIVLEVQAVRLDRQAARQLATERSRVFASLFEIKRTGYPGQQTTFVECPEEFQPIHTERALPGGGFLDGWTSWSNANRVPGACSPDLALHRSVTAHLFCPASETFLRIDWSVPGEGEGTARAADFVNQIDCGSL